jgi:hypothetical protein
MHAGAAATGNAVCSLRFLTFAHDRGQSTNRLAMLIGLRKSRQLHGMSILSNPKIVRSGIFSGDVIGYNNPFRSIDERDGFTSDTEGKVAIRIRSHAVP